MKQKKKAKKWMKFRHKVFRSVLYYALAPYCRLKYGIKIEPFKNQEKRPYLILFNHQTAFDQFFVGVAFKGPVYYLASEDLFSKGWVSSLIRYLVEPIPIKKQTTDVKAVMNCIRVVREGGTLALAPEGNRTFSGRTEYMSDAIAPLARKLNVPIALYRIEGGYGAQPRWSDVVRKGKMRGYVSRVIEPEEFKDLSDDELFQIIKDGLYVDEAVADAEFRHKKSAEYLERAVYVCPHCGLSKFFSSGDLIECEKCGRRVQYLPTKELKGIGFDLPFKFFADWYDYQTDFVNKLDLLSYTDTPIYTEKCNFSEVIPYVNKKRLYNDMDLLLYGDRIELKKDGVEYVYPFDETSAVTVLGKNKINIYFGDNIYQIKSDKRFNALKYVNLFHRYKNIKAGNENGQFLGL